VKAIPGNISAKPDTTTEAETICWSRTTSGSESGSTKGDKKNQPVKIKVRPVPTRKPRLTPFM
jgi:hypothetical protein